MTESSLPSGPSGPAFLDLIDLASETCGGAAIACNDEFFAEKENLLKPAEAVWKDHLYTDRGKWMDGWETRRRRPQPAVGHANMDGEHDWCIVRLGMPGVIRGIVVDTAFFKGNFPESCMISAASIEDALDLGALEAATWTEILPRSPLQGDHKNMFTIAHDQRVTHLKLEIFPDGGVARLRVHGEVVPEWARLRTLGGPVDLAALENGAVVETCSDMFFGSRNNLIKPGPPFNMSDGWETRRRRGPGNDWAIVRLAAAGMVEKVEIDTTHFKGNAPGRCRLEGVNAPGVPADQLTGWRTLVESPLQPHTRHVFDGALRRVGELTHLRLSVFPCGGIARLRAWGNLAIDVESPTMMGVAKLGSLTPDERRTAFLRCCASRVWADGMVHEGVYEDLPALLRHAERLWWLLGPAAHNEAFAGHPAIGEVKVPTSGDAAWSTGEQKVANAAATSVLAELAEANRRYREKFGFVFLVCAQGRSAEAMLADLRVRFERSPEAELQTAAEEQIKITRLRLVKLANELGDRALLERAR
ncbi:MAG: allantoicase [Deltaproteobacteria bacterium]|nr:allantoicase [Deltaproteobacteria bacterium]